MILPNKANGKIQTMNNIPVSLLSVPREGYLCYVDDPSDIHMWSACVYACSTHHILYLAFMGFYLSTQNLLNI